MSQQPDLSNDEAARETYQRRMLEITSAFEQGATGIKTVRDRSDAIDSLVVASWSGACQQEPRLVKGIALVAVGGYGRGELFPHSDVDLMFLIDPKISDKMVERVVRDPIRRMNQSLWDSGLRNSPLTRKLNECERFNPENAEFSLALLDHRLIAGDEDLYVRLKAQVLPKLLERDREAMLKRLAEITAARHAKYGGTLFHLEPNIKECPGGLRDVHVCNWIARLKASSQDAKGRAAQTPNSNGHRPANDQEYLKAVAFLQLLRCFLHLRHERDDNTLDWHAQDAAAAAAVGMEGGGLAAPDPAYWMRLYFRNARIIERRVMQMLDGLPRAAGKRLPKFSSLSTGLRLRKKPQGGLRGFSVDRGAIVLAAELANSSPGGTPIDPAHDPETVLRMFEAMSSAGYRLSIEAEDRLSQALPLLSADLEEGPTLWRHIEAILRGAYAGSTLRAMHALGILELLIPEFHGIDALVIRDAYHRYTVDEHTFVLIDTLHELENFPAATESAALKSAEQAAHPMAEWAARFGQLLRDLQQPGLLYLLALLHDTGKGRTTRDHAQESVRMAESVLSRLEMDGYENNLVLRLIASHLEMSAALRRDIFDTDTVRAFAAKVQTPEALRILTLFTYADIQAVHPDALTPWKAENLWRLYLATSNYLERNLDEERVEAHRDKEHMLRVTAMMPDRRHEVEQFLQGLPARYLNTRSPEQVRSHFERSTRLDEDPVQLEFTYSPSVNELTLVTPDRPLLFADTAGALTAWGMNIITAEAFSNRNGVVVDSFRFNDSFRTLEMNASERARFVQSVHDVLSGLVPIETLLHGRRRGRRRPPMMRVEARIDFDDQASAHSTLVQVVAQDTPGLLHVLSLTLAGAACNVDVALIDTEGETAIDVFYVTKNKLKLDSGEQQGLRQALLLAIEEHSRQGTAFVVSNSGRSERIC